MDETLQNNTEQKLPAQNDNKNQAVVQNNATQENQQVQDESLEGKTIVEFSEDEKPKPQAKERKPHKPFFLLKIILAVTAVCLLGAAIFGSWNRWFRYDDAKELVSNWQVNKSGTNVLIDEKHIIMGPDAVLDYTLDTGAKLIYYQTGDKTGVSHYRFSWDHNQVAIIENSGTSAIDTILSDIGWFWDQSTCSMNGIDLSPAYTKNNIQEVDTENTGLDDIMNNGQSDSILLDRIATAKPSASE